MRMILCSLEIDIIAELVRKKGEKARRNYSACQHENATGRDTGISMRMNAPRLRLHNGSASERMSLSCASVNHSGRVSLASAGPNYKGL